MNDAHTLTHEEMATLHQTWVAYLELTEVLLRAAEKHSQAAELLAKGFAIGVQIAGSGRDVPNTRLVGVGPNGEVVAMARVEVDGRRLTLLN